MTLPRIVRAAALALLACLASCAGAHEMLFGPTNDDPMDGYKGSLSEAGVNTEMDWGPKQVGLLSEYKVLKEDHARLKQRLDQLQGEGQGTKAQLASASDDLDKERTLRNQAEAEAEMLRTRRRELEARVLSLSIEKAKLEQTALLTKIAEMQRAMDDASATAPADAPAAPVRR
jgi:hypothetical protein